VKNERWQINEKTGRKERKRIRFKEKKEVKERSLHYFDKNIEEKRYTIGILATDLFRLFRRFPQSLSISL